MSDPIDEFPFSSIVSLLVDDIMGDIAFGNGRSAKFETFESEPGYVSIKLNEAGARNLARFLICAQHAKLTRDTGPLRRNDASALFPNYAKAKARNGGSIE